MMSHDVSYVLFYGPIMIENTWFSHCQRPVLRGRLRTGRERLATRDDGRL